MRRQICFGSNVWLISESRFFHPNQRMIIRYQLANFGTSLFEFQDLVLLGDWDASKNLKPILTKNHETNKLFNVVKKRFYKGGWHWEKSRNSTHPNQLWLKLKTHESEHSTTPVPIVKALRSLPRGPSTTAWPSTKKCSRHPCPFRVKKKRKVGPWFL